MYLLTIIHILVTVHRTVGLELEMVENALVDVQSWFSIQVWLFLFSDICCSRRCARLQKSNLNLQNSPKLQFSTLAKLDSVFFLLKILIVLISSSEGLIQ